MNNYEFKSAYRSYKELEITIMVNIHHDDQTSNIIDNYYFVSLLEICKKPLGFDYSNF